MDIVIRNYVPKGVIYFLNTKYFQKVDIPQDLKAEDFSVIENIADDLEGDKGTMDLKKLAEIIVGYNHAECIFEDIINAFPETEKTFRTAYMDEWGETLEAALERSKR
jgi:hypothetical protein